MTLAFRTEIEGKPTYFPDKIIECLQIPNSRLLRDLYIRFPNYELYKGIDLKPKLHTIREDKSDRWKAGNNIHFVINNRTPKRFQFAPIVKCVSIQKIEIYYPALARFPVVLIDCKKLTTDKCVLLANNDGFDSLYQFFDWFNKDFTGKIIHWTNLKY